MPFNVTVIGYGMSAKIFHIPFITNTPGLKLHSIVQRNPTAPAPAISGDSRDSAAQDHPNVVVHTSVADALSDPDVHVAVITTPPPTHFSLAKLALDKGKHTLVEKPFVTTAGEAKELRALAKTAGRLICVYQNRRWDSDFLTVQKLINEGTLGRIVEADTHFDRYRPQPPVSWKGSLGITQGGSAIYDLGTHLIDQAYVLFGLPTVVYATFVDERQGILGLSHNPSSLSAVLKYDTGCLVNIRISIMSAEERQRRFWVRGTTGSYHKFGLDPQEDQLKAGMKVTDEKFGHEDESMHGVLSVVQGDGRIKEIQCPTVEPATYREFYRQFAAALASGKEEDIPVKAEEAEEVLRIIEALRESGRDGREVRL